MATRQEPSDRDAGDLRDRSLGELLKQLSEETTRLVHQELELAKAELTQKGRQAGQGAGLFGAAGTLGFLAVAALTTCFILALDAIMPAGLAALLVAVAYGAVAAVLAIRGRAKVKQAIPPLPEQTIETVKEDVEWAKTQTTSAKRSSKPGPRWARPWRRSATRPTCRHAPRRPWPTRSTPRGRRSARRPAGRSRR